MEALLLGEQHDAPEHQQWQANTLRWLHTQGQLAAVVLEMAESGTSTAGLPANAHEDDVRAALRWNTDAWPWQTYAPVVMTAVAANVPVYGGNLPRQHMHTAMQDSQWDTRLPQAAWQRQRQAIHTGHCHMLPEAQITPMTRIQLARDASMARAVVAALEARTVQRGIVVLIAGSAHVQRDVGVPAWLPASTPVKVAIAHAGEGEQALHADHIHTTPAWPARDYCSELRRRARETLNNSSSQAKFADWDGLQGAKRSNSGAIASICNAADRPSPQIFAARGIDQRFPR